MLHEIRRRTAIARNGGLIHTLVWTLAVMWFLNSSSPSSAFPSSHVAFSSSGSLDNSFIGSKNASLSTPIADLSPVENDEITDILKEFWIATNGQYWTQYRWNFDEPWTEWPGIAVEDDGSYWMYMFGNNMSGVFNDRFFHVPFVYVGLQGNNIGGTIPRSLCNNSLISTLVLSNNRFEGELPDCIGSSFSLSSISVANNHLTGTIPQSLYNLRSLIFIVLNGNRFEGSLSPAINNLQLLQFLDLSNNQLSGTLPDSLGSIPSLTHLMLTNNRFTGTMTKTMLQPMGLRLSKFLIANNDFDGPLLNLTFLGNATVINVSNNRLTGPLMLLRLLGKISYLDISFNEVNARLSSVDLMGMFTVSDLAYFNALGNNILPTNDADLTAFPFEFIGDTQLKTSSTNWTCKSVSTRDQGTTIILDPSYFNYTHCSCIRGYFGLPPNHCFPCPTNAAFCRNGLTLEIPPDEYPYPVYQSLEQAQLSIVLKSSETSKRSSIASTSIETEISVWDRFISDDSGTGVADTLEGDQPVFFENCPGVNACSTACSVKILVPEDGSPFKAYLANHEESHTHCPCNAGHEGRQCSQCICDPTPSTNYCFYRRSNSCIRCSSVWSHSESYILIFGVLGSLFVISTVIHVLVLRSRRSLDKKPHADRNIIQRAFYRILQVRTIGYFKLLLIYIQTLSAIVTWPSAVLQRFTALLQISTGNTAGMGISCLWTPLRKPLFQYLVFSAIPLILIIILVASLFVAHVIWTIFLKPKSIVYEMIPSSTIDSTYQNTLVSSAPSAKFSTPTIESASDTSSSMLYSGDDVTEFEQSEDELDFKSATFASDRLLEPLVDAEGNIVEEGDTSSQPIGTMMVKEVNTMRYFSAKSLAIAELLGLGYFFYFGVTLSSLSWFTCETQFGTGAEYLQEFKWIRCASKEAHSAKLTSIPFFFVYSFGVPVGFASLLFYYRKRIHLRIVNDIVGGLYRCYKKELFWWELVVLARRLTLALVLRISRESAFYMWSAIMVLVISVAFQFLFQPFHQAGENRAEEVSILILILTFVAQEASQSTQLHSVGLFWVSFVINALFLLVTLALVIRSWWITPINPDDD